LSNVTAIARDYSATLPRFSFTHSYFHHRPAGAASRKDRMDHKFARYITSTVACLCALSAAAGTRELDSARLATKPPTLAANEAVAAPSSPPVDSADAKRRIWDIVMKNGKRVSEPAVLQVHQGDEVTLRVTSDAPDELHLHGYNLSLQVVPETTATLRFTAKLTGRFPVESHKTEATLGAVEVYPQ
jgi:heme/copper-type cytochrome/quinol oxidase subunit 2